MTRRLTAWMMAFAVAVPAASLWGAAPAPGSVSGQAVDVGGRPLAHVRVELLEAVGARPVGRVVRATATDAAGAWAFGRVPSGDYVARVGLGGQTAGVAVSVRGAAEHVRIVAPSIAGLAMQGQGTGATGGVLGTLGGGSTAVGAVVVGGIVSGATVATMYFAKVGPFRDDQS